MHNMDKVDTEGGAGSLGGTASLWDQGEAPSHTGVDPFCLTDPLIHVLV